MKYGFVLSHDTTAQILEMTREAEAAGWDGDLRPVDAAGGDGGRHRARHVGRDGLPASVTTTMESGAGINHDRSSVQRAAGDASRARCRR